jgi:hypothetical protein
VLRGKSAKMKVFGCCISWRCAFCEDGYYCYCSSQSKDIIKKHPSKTVLFAQKGRRL